MPTEREYLEAEQMFGLLMEDVTRGGAWLGDDWSKTATRGGRVTRDVGEAISASEGMTRTICSVFDGLQVECKRRAAVCKEYQLQYDQWKRDREQWIANGSIPKDKPIFPSKPATWVDKVG